MCLESHPKHSLYAKVVRMVRGSPQAGDGEIEVVLTIQPAQTRLVFAGTAPVSVGEYLKFSLTGGKARIAGKELKVARVTWVTDP